MNAGIADSKRILGDGMKETDILRKGDMVTVSWPLEPGYYVVEDPKYYESGNDFDMVLIRKVISGRFTKRIHKATETVKKNSLTVVPFYDMIAIINKKRSELNKVEKVLRDYAAENNDNGT